MRPYLRALGHPRKTRRPQAPPRHQAHSPRTIYLYGLALLTLTHLCAVHRLDLWISLQLGDQEPLFASVHHEGQIVTNVIFSMYNFYFQTEFLQKSASLSRSLGRLRARAVPRLGKA